MRLNKSLRAAPTGLTALSFASGFGRLLAMCFLRSPKHSGGPLQWEKTRKVPTYMMRGC